jgi:hypothetical protein
MNRRLRDLQWLLVTEAEPYGALVRIERTGGDHLKAVFTVADREAIVITSQTPSDRRHFERVKSDVRRTLRNLKGVKT